MELLAAKDESRVQKTLEENALDEDYMFSSKDGFNVAFALSSLTKPTEFVTEFESYGRLQLLYNTKNNDKNGHSSKVIPT